MVSCAKGLNVEVCIVDAQKSGFQCSKDKKSRFLSFDQGKELLCTSSKDAEEFLKSCKQHEILPITICSYNGLLFECTPPNGTPYKIAPETADNFMCLSEKDRRRLTERCK